MAVSKAPTDKNGIWDMEYTTTREEKIRIIDEYTNGEMSHVLDVINVFEEEKDILKTDSHGNIKNVSIKAWLRKHPCESIIDGEIRILGLKRQFRKYGEKHPAYDYHHDLVDETFHKLLYDLEQKEKIYYRTNDERRKLCEEFVGHPLAGFFKSEIHIRISNIDGLTSQDGKPLSIAQIRYLVNEMNQTQKNVEEIIKEAAVKAHKGFPDI